MNLLTQSLVLDAIVKASLILAVTAVIATLSRRASAAARHMIWTLGLFGALTAPVLALALPRWEVPLVRISVDSPAISSRAIEPDLALVAATRGGQPAFDGGRTQDAPIAAAVTAPSQNLRVEAGGSARTLPPWSSLLLMIWTIGAALIVGRVLVGLAAVQWMSRRTRVVTDAPWLPQAHALARGLGIWSTSDFSARPPRRCPWPGESFARRC